MLLMGCCGASGMEHAVRPSGHLAEGELRRRATHPSLFPNRSTLSLPSTLQGSLVGVFGQHEWDLVDSTTWQDPAGPACEQSPPSAAGLTPRQILCRTPRKTHWPSVSGSGGGSGPTASPRRLFQGSAAQLGAPNPGQLQEPGGDDEGLGCRLQRLALPSGVAAQQGSGEEKPEGGAAEQGSQPGSAGPVGLLLAEAARQSKAARDRWAAVLRC